METLYLIDGHAQFFRAYHAIRTAMTSPVTHEPTNMTYGFVGMLLKVLRDYRPDYLAVAIDVSGDTETFRSEIYPQYKAQREAPPEDFRPQVDRCLAVLDQMGVPVIGVAGVEADDVIATLVARLERERPDLRIRVVSRDKDLTQMLRDGVELFDVHTDRSVAPSDVFKTEGVEPRHVIDILSLMGDSIDNVPGVKGVGPKTAAKLVLQYGSAENLLAHLDELKGKLRENLEASRDQIPLARRLVELKEDVPFEFDLEDARADPETLPVTELEATFRELDFRQHAQTLRELAGGSGGHGDGGDTVAVDVASAGAREKPPPPEPEGGLFAHLDPAPPPPPRAPGEYRAVTTAGELRSVLDEIRDAGACAVDTETSALAPLRAELCGVSLAWRSGQAVYVPTRSPEPSSHLAADEVLGALRAILEDESIASIGHNLKYDMLVLRRHGVRLRGPIFDTMVASYVIDATRSSHKLDVLALSLLDHTCTPITDLIGPRGRRQRSFESVPLEQAVPYAAEDADVALRLRDVMVPMLDETGLRTLFETVEMPLVHVLAELEFNGIRVDPDELERQRAHLAERIDDLRDRISGAAPHPFNPDSPKQLAAALFNAPDQEPPGLGIKSVRRGKTGPSTDVEVLEKLAADPEIDSEVPGLIIEYRQLTKLVSTYLVALGEAIDPDTGRVHASFNQVVAATGRLSSSDPNLQNIPIRTDVGREIRRAFVAEPGNVLITADYSQIELRLLAHLAQDPALVDAFHQGLDIHTAVAAEVFGVGADDVTATQRTMAKMVNFGIVYGITPFGLARRLGRDVSVSDAAQIIEDYKARFDRIDAFLAQCVASAITDGYVETILGRRRRIPQIASRNPAQRALGERMAINTVVQGSAADLIKLAMIDLHARLPEAHPDARLLLQIHDELVLEAPEAGADDLQAFVVERMEQAMTLDVPLVADAARSTVWIDAK